MIDLDIKKLGRFERIGHRITGDRSGYTHPSRRGTGCGWEFVHVCVDDASRVSFTQIDPNEKAPGAVAHLKASVAYFQTLGVSVRRVLTDNGACYKSHAFRDACHDLGLKHVRTKPYTPRTNGKAERFIQTALREWAYARAYDTSDQRAEALPPGPKIQEVHHGEVFGHSREFGPRQRRQEPIFDFRLNDLGQMDSIAVTGRELDCLSVGPAPKLGGR